MLKFSRQFLYRILCSRLGLLLTFVHLCLMLYSFGLKKRLSLECHLPFNIAGTIYLAGRSVHLYYETPLLQVLLLLDLPGTLLALVLALPGDTLLWLLKALLPEMCISTRSWIMAIILLGTTSIQWCSIGYWIEHKWKTWRPFKRDST